jgi:hypothetical protein
LINVTMDETNGAGSVEDRPGRRAPRLRVDALKGLSLGVPQRVHALLAAEDACLTPGPCQSEHSLTAALGDANGAASAQPAQNDPEFVDPTDF